MQRFCQIEYEEDVIIPLDEAFEPRQALDCLHAQDGLPRRAKMNSPRWVCACVFFTQMRHTRLRNGMQAGGGQPWAANDTGVGC